MAHALFGPGVVVDSDGRDTTVAVAGSGVRKFVNRLIQLESCDLPLPVRPTPQRARRRPVRPLASDQHR